MFSLISFFIYNSTYLSKSLAQAYSLPRILINHQLINQQVHAVPTRWSRHSRNQLVESPGLFGIFAWRTVRTSQVSTLWIILSEVDVKSVHCLIYERLLGEYLDLSGNWWLKCNGHEHRHRHIWNILFIYLRKRFSKFVCKSYVTLK